jgi:hypothetical protein
MGKCSAGVVTVTGAGLAEAFKGAQVVVDVTNSPSFEDAAVLKFFETSTRNLLSAEAAGGVEVGQVPQPRTLNIRLHANSIPEKDHIGTNTVKHPRALATQT